MLKFVIIVGLVFVTVSSAPLDSEPLEKPADSHTFEFIRPSPINPDIPMDPKPPERIVLDDSTDRDSKSLSEKTPAVENEPQENLKVEARDNEPSGENEKKKLNDEKELEKSENNQSDEKPVRIEYNHDDVSDSGALKTSIKAKESSNQSTKSDEPIIVYAVKGDEKQRSESFQTSHRIPNVGDTERQFETSHHIPGHIDSERQKLIETSKVGEKL
ncbi:uncharacterized protein LOC119080520 [Bradysia coprophila]|uniref:uncharacterized protein LOC119080520 n=1 Tax=Bradysia coprophila TaxID=38358 RepID=UPI00187D84B2|nr:uncharacterized protein LOC119080520 [Bradysia coprophila]